MISYKYSSEKLMAICSGLLFQFLPLNTLADNCKRPPNLYNLDYIVCPREGLSKAEKSGKYGFIDLKGKMIVPFVYDKTSSFSEGLAGVERESNTFFINAKGNIIFKVDNTIEVLSDFNEGMLVAKRNGKIGFIDKKGQVSIPFQYANASDFKEGLAVVVQDDIHSYLWGFIDKSGKQVIPFHYTVAEKFSEGLSAVELNHKWGFIDKTGKTVIPFIFDYATYFENGLAEVEIDGKWLKIDKTGTPIQ